MTATVADLDDKVSQLAKRLDSIRRRKGAAKPPGWPQAWSSADAERMA